MSSLSRKSDAVSRCCRRVEARQCRFGLSSCPNARSCRAIIQSAANRTTPSYSRRRTRQGCRRASLNANSGAVTWTTPDPLGSRAEAAVGVANGVIFECNLDYTNGTMYELDSSNGKVLWSFNSGGACNAGPAIADGVVFWGSGSTSGPGPLKLFAFGL
nr:PQQ-binding-like beta-propeller repeat protein [Paraburkholderia tuberum]